MELPHAAPPRARASSFFFFFFGGSPPGGGGGRHRRAQQRPDAAVRQVQEERDGARLLRRPPRDAGGGLGGGAGDDPGGVDDGGDDGAACGVPAGVPPQDLPLRLLPPADAEPVGPHLRHHLVGHRAQPHGLLRRRPCGGRVLVPSRGAEGDQVPQGAVLPSPARVLVVRGGRRVRQPALLRRGRGDLHRRRRQAGLGQRRQGQEHVPWRRRRELPVRRLQVDRHAGGQHQPPREDAAPHLLGPHDPQHVREPGEHDGVAGDRVQHRDHHGRADPGDHADREHQGVPERDHVQEAGDAHAAAERGVVDEAQEPAAGLPAPGPAVRAPAVGGHPGRRRVPDRARPPRGAPPGHQVPPLPRPRPPGPALPAHGRPRPREHVRPRQIPHLPQRRNHCEGRGPGAEDAVHSAGAPGVQPDAAERGDEQLHAGAGELQRGRAAVVVPEEAIHGAAAAVVVHAGDHGEHGGVRAGRRRRQVRDAPLPLHIHQRQGAPQRALLLARVAHLGGGRRAARLEAVQAPQDAGVALLHQAPAAAVQVLLHGGGEAPALHRHPRLAQAQPRRRFLVVGLATPGSWISIGCQPMRAQKTRSMP